MNASVITQAIPGIDIQSQVSIVSTVFFGLIALSLAIIGFVFASISNKDSNRVRNSKRIRPITPIPSIDKVSTKFFNTLITFCFTNLVLHVVISAAIIQISLSSPLSSFIEQQPFIIQSTSFPKYFTLFFLTAIPTIMLIQLFIWKSTSNGLGKFDYIISTIQLVIPTLVFCLDGSKNSTNLSSIFIITTLTMTLTLLHSWLILMRK